MKWHIKTFKQQGHCLPLWKRVWSAQEGRCFYCGQRMRVVDGGFSQDHFFPKYIAGARRLLNTVLCHTQCNKKKGTRYPTPKETERFVRIWGKVTVYREEEPWMDDADAVRLARRASDSLRVGAQQQ